MANKYLFSIETNFSITVKELYYQMVQVDQEILCLMSKVQKLRITNFIK